MSHAMLMIHFTGTAANPQLKLKRPAMLSMIGLRITYGSNHTHLSGTEAQIKRLITLALDSARSNVALSRPSVHVTQQELNDLHALNEEWFAP